MKFFPNKKEGNINIELDGIQLERCGSLFPTKSVRFLGVEIDDKLNFSLHIDKISNKLRSIIYLLSTINKKFPIHIRILMMKALFMPHLNYCLALWGNNNSIKTLQKYQKWCIRNATNQAYYSHTSLLFFKNNIIQLPDLLKLTINIKLRKFIKFQLPACYNEMLTYYPEKKQEKNGLPRTYVNK